MTVSPGIAYTESIKPRGGVSMLCQETGATEVVRLEHLKLQDAKKLNDMIGVTNTYNGGFGSFLHKLENGRITVIDWAMRVFMPKGDNN